MLAPLQLSPLYGAYAEPMTDDELCEVFAPNWCFLPSDGVQPLFENVARFNAKGVRQSLVSDTWLHRTHTHGLRFYVHATSAPRSSDCIFFGVTEASLAWDSGRTEGVDNAGRVRRGDGPQDTQRDMTLPLPAPAPVRATFVITIDFLLGRATIATFKNFLEAEAGDDPIFTHHVDISAWSSARLWITAGSVGSVVCLAKVEVV